MKHKFLIIAFLTFSLMAAFALKSHAQRGVQNLKYPPESEEVKSYEVIADDTYMTYTKTGAKIQCSNEKAHFKLYEKWQHTFIHYGWRWKKDRHGDYKFYVIVISKKDGELIKQWAKSNL